MIYAVTIHIKNESETAWAKWMVENHVPDVMETGLFLNCRMMRSKLISKKGHTTYMMHYEVESQQQFEEYEEKHAARLRNDVLMHFKGALTAERDLLEITARF